MPKKFLFLFNWVTAMFFRFKGRGSFMITTKQTLKSFFRNYPLCRPISRINQYRDWSVRGFGPPSPQFIKHACLLRNGIPKAPWVETGTYLGHTTELLARNSTQVYSIEPEPTLFLNAKKHFSAFSNVEVINGLSEEIFPILLPRISGDVNFWLDGHFSGGITFKGKKDTPVIDELNSINENLDHFNRVCVLIDDIRYCDPQSPDHSDYPTIDFLVDWARRSKLIWHIEHDIFIAKN